MPERTEADIQIHENWGCFLVMIFICLIIIAGILRSAAIEIWGPQECPPCQCEG